VQQTVGLLYANVPFQHGNEGEGEQKDNDAMFHGKNHFGNRKDVTHIKAIWNAGNAHLVSEFVLCDYS